MRGEVIRYFQTGARERMRPGRLGARDVTEAPEYAMKRPKLTPRSNNEPPQREFRAKHFAHVHAKG
jgi:hypothetical protein